MHCTYVRAYSPPSQAKLHNKTERKSNLYAIFFSVSAFCKKAKFAQFENDDDGFEGKKNYYNRLSAKIDKALKSIFVILFIPMVIKVM